MPAPAPVHPALPCLLAWLVPGSGHLKIGRKWPALFVAATVLGLFVAGMALAGFENVSHVRHPWYFALHAFAGLPTLAADLLTRDVQLTERMPHRSVGELYTAMAGLLNLVAMADVWARCAHGDPEERGTSSGAPSAAPAEPPTEEPRPTSVRDLIAPAEEAPPARE